MNIIISQPSFDKDYYDEIWGTVHRHEYCETLSNELIKTYGKVRFLDIGTGCGYLVRLLNEKGATAFGIDVSDYAIENSHGNVVKASVVDIPFKDRSFDVVFSQGMWEYVSEEDIPRAIKECYRVGKVQKHNIDTTLDTADWSKEFKTHKSQEWWNERLKLPKVLVACPNHLCKEYSFQRWIDNVKKLTYPNYDIYVSDNSPDAFLLKKYGDQIPMDLIDITGMEGLAVKRQNYSMEQIRQEFLNGPYERLMIIESDVIPALNVIEVLLSWGRDSDWISHAYPARDASSGNEDELRVQGLGCSLFSRRLIEKYDFKGFEDNYLADGGMWMKVRPDKTMKTMELWGYLDSIKHLGD